MSVRVRGNLRDLWAFFRLVPERRRRIRRAAAASPADPTGELARRLHPDCLQLVIESVHQETESARTFRLVPAAGAACVGGLPMFRAGQYLSLLLEVGGSTISRPYSISSSPDEAAQHNRYELTVRRNEGGLAAPHIFEHWRPGVEVRATGPHGEFVYEPLRDTADLVLLAGGCGITPFRSLLRDVRANFPEVRCTLLYGVRGPADLLFRDELEALQSAEAGRFRAYTVCSEPDAQWRGPTGLLNAALIRELAGDLSGKTIFVSGSAEMHEFLDAELPKLGLAPGRVRREVRGELADVTLRPDFPRALADRVFSLTVRRADGCLRLPARADETVLVALERGALTPPAACRSGQCGFCRSRLFCGEVYVVAETDGRRQADLALGYIHPCSAYPLSDLEIEVPANPAQAEEPAAVLHDGARR
jgi:ferredoxin-NADP reductase